MRYSLLRDHVQKKLFLKRNMYIKDIERTHLISWKFFKKKLEKLVSSKSFSKSFSDASNLDIEQGIIKQRNMLKTFDIQPHKAISKKHLVPEEEINLISQDRIGNID